MNAEQIAKLKELALKAIEKDPWPFYLTAFHREATPENILEVIALAERTTSPVSQMTEHKGGDQIQRPGDKAESNQGHKPVLIDNDPLLVRKVHPAPVEGTFTREEARAAVLAVAAQPQPQADESGLPG